MTRNSLSTLRQDIPYKSVLTDNLSKVNGYSLASDGNFLSRWIHLLSLVFYHVMNMKETHFAFGKSLK